MIRLTVVLLLALAGPVAALEINLPTTARQTVQRDTGPDVYAAPTDVFENGKVATVTVEGNVERAAWRLDSAGLTPFQVMRPLRAQLVEAGFDLALDCAGDACGGFDFRFSTETLPGPNMYVNIRAFHFVTGTRSVEGQVVEVVTILASTSATSAYVQIIHAGTFAAGGTTVATSAAVPVAAKPATKMAKADSIGGDLGANGHVVLPDLEFGTGTTELGQGPFASLSALAAYLKTDADMRVALVGHTDTVGGLQANINISRARARSVRQRLITGYGIAASRLDAEGMGYLAPVANNLEAAGRDQNRRVEVVLLGPSE